VPKITRKSALLAVLLVCLLFLPPFNGFLRQGIFLVEDYFDDRPEQSALFIGNSRTFYHNMPAMVRTIADSAGYTKKLHIEMAANPGVSLGFHLKNEHTQKLLSQKWDHVVLQVLSSDQYSAEQSPQAWQDATSLIRQVQDHGSIPAMFVTWRYTDRCVKNAGMPTAEAKAFAPSGYANMHTNIQEQHAHLAASTGVDLVNVGLVWEALQSQPLRFSLYDDCNHPSIYGSYIAALMFYSYFSGNDVKNVTFKPDEISSEDAEMLKQAVSRDGQTNASN
jgi:hypothetical protein